jgi:hypothetical protein
MFQHKNAAMLLLLIRPIDIIEGPLYTVICFADGSGNNINQFIGTLRFAIDSLLLLLTSRRAGKEIHCQ